MQPHPPYAITLTSSVTGKAWNRGYKGAGRVGKTWLMEEATVIKLVSQFLDEHGFQLTLQALQEESGGIYEPESAKRSGELQAILDDHIIRLKQKRSLEVSVNHLFSRGEGEYANRLLKSLNDVSGGVNILVVRLIENGVLIFGGAKSLVGIGEFTLPLSLAKPPITPVVTLHSFCDGAVLAIDVHPLDRNLVLCGSMDRLAFILDLNQDEDMLLQKFEDHSKYVVRVLWSTSGEFFITASYDKTICVYRVRESKSRLYNKIQSLFFKGVIESLAFCKEDDTFVVGVRDDYLLHCYNLSTGIAEPCRDINMNSLGDDYVSFVPMHISFSPDGQFILVSTDRDRLELYSWNNGKEVTSFHGAYNDELSQPRHCWDYSGKYIYGTSQDKSIVVWEVRSQKVVAKLEGHTATVRDLYFCSELKSLVSCGFDGSVKLWKCVAEQS